MLRVVFSRVVEDRVDQLRAWMAELMRRQDEVRETFAQEGVRHEVAYLLQTGEGPLLIYAIEAEDHERAREAYAASRLPLDLEHRRVMRSVLAGTFPVEPVYDVSLPRTDSAQDVS